MKPWTSCFDKRYRFQRGFSLIELAVVLMIIGTLMSGVLVAVSNSVVNARITTARAQLREVEEALYGFAQANARLPCPATDASAGFEDITSGNCYAMHGFVPFGTLGIYGPVNDKGFLLDPWQNPLRYSLYSLGGINPDFSDPDSIETWFKAGTPLGPTSMFKICPGVVCTQPTVAPVPAVVLSLGANGNNFTSSDEAVNAGDDSMSGYSVKDDLDFVSAQYSEENFDDQLVWISPYVLFNRLVSAGKLP